MAPHLQQLLFVLLFGSATCLRIKTAETDPAAVRDVLSRMPSWVSNELEDLFIGSSGQVVKGSARVIGSARGITVEATTAVDALYAIHAYLREFCGSMVTWEESHFSDGCSRPATFERVYNAPKVRFFGNPCTFSYSFAWWDWPSWERMIDWLALSGFNMVLAPVGQEALWKDVWRGLGVSESGLDEFFTGPAFYAWHRMGNLQHLAGPASDALLQSQLQLNMKIVARLNALGMVPVLPTFAGFVPPEYAKNSQKLKFTQNSCWINFNQTNSCLYSLDPEETSAFEEIAATFINAQKGVYGDKSTHVYSADPFNEIPPKQLTQEQTTGVAQNIYNGCMKGDNECIWVLQSWTFSYDGWKESAVKAFLQAVPIGKMLVLDLEAENRPLYKEFNDFYGHYYVWCLLHNFGGNMQLRGNLRKINKDWSTAITSSENLVGAGLTMEAIYQNYVVYQFFIDRFWSDDSISPFAWITDYAKARYGTDDPLIQKAWKILLTTFYDQPDKYPISEDDYYDESEETTAVDIRRPVFLYFRPKFGGSIKYWFNTHHLETLAKYFNTLNRTHGQNVLFRQDYSDVMREHLQYLIGNRAILRIYEGYAINDTTVLRTACDKMERHFEELDLIARRDLSDWLNAARALVPTGSADVYERQARNQLTLWGPSANVLDYARKEWGGLIRKYYAKRWSFFCDYIQQPGVVFNQKKFEERLYLDVELPFGRL